MSLRRSLRDAVVSLPVCLGLALIVVVMWWAAELANELGGLARVANDPVELWWLFWDTRQGGR